MGLLSLGTRVRLHYCSDIITYGTAFPPFQAGFQPLTIARSRCLVPGLFPFTLRRGDGESTPLFAISGE